MDLCRTMVWLPAAQFVVSPRAKPAALKGFHTTEYLAALQREESLQSVTSGARAVRAGHTIEPHLSRDVPPSGHRRWCVFAGG